MIIWKKKMNKKCECFKIIKGNEFITANIFIELCDKCKKRMEDEANKLLRSYYEQRN